MHTTRPLRVEDIGRLRWYACACGYMLQLPGGLKATHLPNFICCIYSLDASLLQSALLNTSQTGEAKLCRECLPSSLGGPHVLPSLLCNSEPLIGPHQCVYKLTLLCRVRLAVTERQAKQPLS
jgi:hypothetical protein